MDTPMEWLRRVGMLLRGRRFDSELEEEMRLHLELREQQQRESGLGAESARRAAYRRFGNPTAIKEKSHMSWGWDWLESFFADVVYGVRSMLRSKALTAVALLSLGLGIGANTAIFSFLDALLLRALPVKAPSRLVLLGKGENIGITDWIASTDLYSYPFYRELQKRNGVFSDTAAAFSMMNQVYGRVEGRRDAEAMNVQLVSGTYFPMLGVQAAMGRMLTDDDDRTEGDHPVMVVSDAWWTRALARDPGVLGKGVKLGDTMFTIVGVAPREFFGTKVGQAPDMWVPMSMVAKVPPHWGSYAGNFDEALYIMGRLKPGVTPEQAEADVNVLYRPILTGFADANMNAGKKAELDKAHVQLTGLANGLSDLRGQYSQPLKMLMTLVGVVLLIACANIANLLLARSNARVREFAVRQALGARRSRLVRQLLTESLMLALVGGGLGIAFAAGADRVLLRMVSGGPETLPLDVSINLRLLGFTLAVTMVTAVLFGTLPALRATKLELTEALKDGRGTQQGPSKSTLARVLVVSQVVFSLVLLVGAGLFVRSLVNLTNVDTGFQTENVMLLKVDPSSAGYTENDRVRQDALYGGIEDRLSAIHGVVAASFSSFTFHEGSWNTGVTVAGSELGRNLNVKHNIIGNAYFKAMGIPLIAGRGFGPQDTATSQKVAVISERLAHTLFPDGNALGHHYHIAGPTSPWEMEVIGIARDVKFGNLDEAPEALDYISYTQRNQYLNDIEVRYTGDFKTVSAEVQAAIHGADRNLPITRVMSLEDQVAMSVTQQRMVAQLSAFFGLLAVFLSCIGIYGLMSYMVSRRTNEIGIRMALGAARWDVRWLVMREICWMVGVGVAIGVPLTLAGGRMVQTMLFGLKGTDVVSLGWSVAVLLVVGLGAGYLPARRASRVEPMTALRYE
jgi:predicted permease